MPVGQAWRTQQVLADGTKVVGLTVVLTRDLREVRVVHESSVRADGSPLRVLQTTTIRDSSFRESVTVQFAGPVARYRRVGGAGRLSADVPAPEGAEVRASSEWWFVRNRPEIGASAKFMRFQLSSQQWVPSETRYEGLADLEVGGKKVRANLVRSGESAAWLDDQGAPLRFELGTRTLSLAR